LGTASLLLSLAAWTRYESWVFIGFFAVTLLFKLRKDALVSRDRKIFFWSAFFLPLLAILFVCVRLGITLGNPLDVVFVPLTEKEIGFPQRMFLMPFILTVKYRYISSGLLAAFLFSSQFIRHKSRVVFLWAFGMLAVFFVASLTKVHSHELERNLMVPVLLTLPFVGNVLSRAVTRLDIRERLLNSITISAVMFFVCVKLYFYVVQTPNVLPPVLENARRAGRVQRDHRNVPSFRFGYDSVFEYQLGPYWNFDAFRVFGDVRAGRDYYFPFPFEERVALLSRRSGPVFYLTSPELIREALRLRRGTVLLEVPSKTGLWASPEQEEPAYSVRPARPYSLLYVPPKD